MKVNLQPYKGARDFYPEDKRFQKWMFAKWRRVFERYGYQEYDAPILEPTDLYLMKGNEEIINEQTYTFADRGDRSVTIRTEMTPSVSRMVAGRRQELVYPLRWYSIPNLWRYERMQRGRLREFWQPNVDIFGVSTLEAEIEMLQIIDDLFQAFKAKRQDYVVKVNSRKLIDAMFKKHFGMDDEETTQLIRATDKIHKTDESVFIPLLDSITNNNETSKAILSVLKTKNLDELPENVKEHPSYKEIQELITQCQSLGITNVEFDITLMRGFDYYTDIVFEAFDTDPENNRSLLGGGRYDGLVGQFGVEPVPTVGFATSDVSFQNFLETHKLLPKLTPETEMVLIVRESESTKGALKAAVELREMGVNVAVDYTERKVDKQFKAAIKSGVRYALFVGKEELKNEQFILKDLKTSKEEKHSLQRIVSIVKDARKK